MQISNIILIKDWMSLKDFVAKCINVLEWLWYNYNYDLMCICEFENMIKLISFITLPMIHNKFKTLKTFRKSFWCAKKV